MKNIFKEKLEYISYTYNHKKAFLKIEKQLLGRNTLRGLLHDLDKIFMYIFLNHNKAHNIHVNRAKHHEKNAKTKKDFIEMIVDWECARYTKPDKPLNAVETLYAYYPQLEHEIYPILVELGLIKN